jgi:hypothetical protein
MAMGIENINGLKPVFQIEQFPDDIHEVPVKGPSGETIGDAVVTIENGMWKADLKLSVEAAKNLGLGSTLVHSSFFNGEKLELHVYPRTDVNWGNRTVQAMTDDTKESNNGTG